MTQETYENLRRVEERRKSQATRSGNWKAVNEAILRIQSLEYDMREANKPTK